MEYKKLRTLTEAESAYIAGIIDGEGTIGMTRKGKGMQRQLVVTISSTERELLEYIKETTGVGKITSKKTYDVRHATGHTYHIANRQALALLRLTSRFLRTYKRHRVALVLDKYLLLTPRNGKYTENVKKKRERFVAEFLKIRAHIQNPL